MHSVRPFFAFGSTHFFTEKRAARKKRPRSKEATPKEGRRARSKSCASVPVVAWEHPRHASLPPWERPQLSLLDLNDQFPRPRVGDDDHGVAAVSLSSSGGDRGVADIIKLVTQHAIDADLEGAFDELRAARLR